MTEKKISFGKIFWPSLIAALIVSIVGIFLFFATTIGLISSLSDFKPQSMSVEDNTILHMTLNGRIAEESETKFNKTRLDFDDKIGLNDLLFGFKEASKDERIKGIYIDIQNVECGYSTAREIRKAINEFEKSGKFAIAYNSGEFISQKEYYIASAANLNYGFPTSTIEFVGLGTELTYFKNTLSKLEIEMQVIRGKNNDFKSAVEPFFRENMSDSSRIQIERYLNSLWFDIREDIAKDRKISADKLNDIAENLSIKRIEDAKKYKLIDDLKYRDEIMEILHLKADVKKEDDLNFLEFEKYSKKKFNLNQLLVTDDNPTVAVILAEGEITTNGDEMTSEEICSYFQEVRKNKSIKTVILRINSPGGSALASDEIWREVKITNKSKKVIVSMGDVAASGGYYIASASSYIFAEPTTITGSIGVFGIIPYTGKFLSNKLGLTFDRAYTNQHSVFSLNKKLTPQELEFIQDEVDQIYVQFLNRVSEGRKMTVNQVNKIARGRVWTGRDAVKIGLVDQLGGINDAISFASKMANIKDPKVLFYPLKEENPIEELLEKIDEETTSKKSSSATIMPAKLLEYYNQLKELESNIGIQMRLPYQIQIH